MSGLIEAFSNNIATTLNGAMDNSQTTLDATSAAGFPGLSYQYRIIIDAELMLVTGGQTTTTWTVTRGIEGTVATSHANGAVIRAVITAQSLLELQWKDKIVIPSSTGHALDDDFDDSVLDSSWIRVDNGADTANVTWTESGDVLSMRNLGADAASRYHALLKPLNGLSFPITIETATRHFSRYAINNLMFGLGFANGATYGAGTQFINRHYTHSGIATALRLSTQGLNNFNTSVSTSESYDMQTMGGPFYTRLIWSGTNTFQGWVSSDGVSWFNSHVNTSHTITPTHVGFFTSNWGTSMPTIGTAEYFRVFESDKAGNP